MFRRLMMAAAGYMAYRWWNRRSEEAPARTTAKMARVPATDRPDTEVPRRN